MSKILLILILFFISTVQVNAVMSSSKKGVAGAFYPDAIKNTPEKLRQIGASWFYDWHTEEFGFKIADNSCTAFIPMLKYVILDNGVFRKMTIQEAYEKITAVTSTHKGIYWLIGNEPDLSSPNAPQSDGRFGGSDTIFSSYADYAQKIKSLDPNAKIIVGGFWSISEYPRQISPPRFFHVQIIKRRHEIQRNHAGRLAHSSLQLL